MKYILLAILSLLGVSASAQSNVQNVHEVAFSTKTLTQTINLCNSGGATDVTAGTSSGTIVGAYALEVYNLAASTNTIVCGQDVMLSSQPSSAWYGREIPAGIGLFYAIPPATRKTYCFTLNSGGCTRVTVTQFK